MKALRGQRPLDRVATISYKPRPSPAPASAGRASGTPPKAQVAQLVEQRTENPRVGGSNPPLGTILILFLLLINGLEKVGQYLFPWWDSYSYLSCSHFSIALAASFLWRAPFV